MKQLILKNLNGKIIALLFVVTTVVYGIMLGITIPAVMHYAHGMKLPDMLPTGYHAAYIHQLLTALGESGRQAYLYKQLPMDMLYPGLFGITYCLLLAWLLRRLQQTESVLFLFCYLPLLAGLFDYFENFGIITLLKTYPHQTGFMVSVTNTFTILKSGLTTVYFVVLLLVLLMWLWLGISRFLPKR